LSATGGSISGGDVSTPLASEPTGGAPGWAQKLRSEQRLREGISVAAHTIRDGDRPVSGENPKLQNDD
jgi:type IV secretion system protein TrbL